MVDGIGDSPDDRVYVPANFVRGFKNWNRWLSYGYNY